VTRSTLLLQLFLTLLPFMLCLQGRGDICLIFLTSSKKSAQKAPQSVCFYALK